MNKRIKYHSVSPRSDVFFGSQLMGQWQQYSFFQWFQISVLAEQILVTDNPSICLTLLLTEVSMILKLYFFSDN